VAQTSRSGLEQNGKLVLVLVISMLVIFGIAFALNHYVFRLSPGENGPIVRYRLPQLCCGRLAFAG